MIRLVLINPHGYAVKRQRLLEGIAKILKQQQINIPVTLSLSLVSDRKMAILNKKHLHREGTTDVISFPLTETSLRADKIASEFVEYTPERKQLGDIFISYPQAVKQAKQKMIPTEEEVVYLAQHGVLHLLGIHHK